MIEFHVHCSVNVIIKMNVLLLSKYLLRSLNFFIFLEPFRVTKITCSIFHSKIIL